MPKKPQGFNAVTKITAVERGPALLDSRPLQLPNDKAEAEQAIMEMFAASLPKQPAGTAPLVLLTYQKNDENDLDFEITTPDGAFYMELTEFAPLAALNARGYDNAPNTFRVGDLADLLFDCVNAKNKYGPSALKKMLLVYGIHFAFLPSDNVLTLVRSKLAAVHHQFERIIFFAPIEQDFGLTIPLFPASFTRLSAAQRDVVRANVVTNFDPRSVIPTEGGVTLAEHAKSER